MHIISYLFNVLDSDTSTNEHDVWAAVEAISKILQHSPVLSGLEGESLFKSNNSKLYA